MGFLDSMMAKVVKQTTGINAKRVIKKVGARNILMVGGAALAGGVMAQKARQAGPATGSYRTGTGPVGGGQYATGAPPAPPRDLPQAAPPPPPVPPAPPAGRVELPPPPPAAPSQAPAADDELAGPLLFAVVRTVVAAALADGQMDAEERRMIQEHLSDGSLAPDQVSKIHTELLTPASPEELAGPFAGTAEAEALYRAAFLTMQADGEMAAEERAWLQRLGAGLALGAEQCAALEQDLLGALRAE